MIVRLETPGDTQAIRIVEERAFGQRDEARLVDDLRAAGDAVFSLVAVKWRSDNESRRVWSLRSLETKNARI